MAIKSGGGSASRLRVKNQAMAARMKAEGIRRKVARCPVCNRVVGLAGFYHHIVTCR